MPSRATQMTATVASPTRTPLMRYERSVMPAVYGGRPARSSALDGISALPVQEPAQAPPGGLLSFLPLLIWVLPAGGGVGERRATAHSSWGTPRPGACGLCRTE